MPRYAVLTMFAVLLVASLAVGAPATKTISIDCDNGQTISEKLSHPAEELILEISGFCNERVVIERPNVTLRGTSPSVDGIVGPVGLDPENQNDRAMVTIKSGVKDVHFENLSITGSERRGIEVVDEAVIAVDGCRIDENGYRGLQVSNGGYAVVTHTVISNNESFDLITFGGGAISCSFCSIHDDDGAAILSVDGGRIWYIDSTVDIDSPEDVYSFGVYAVESGHVWGRRSNVTSNQYSLHASEGGQIFWREGELDGALLLDRAAQIFLRWTDQTDSMLPNQIYDGSYLQLRYGELFGSTELYDFSTGSSQVATLGDLTCYSGSDFFCDSSVTKNSSTGCGKCPP